MRPVREVLILCLTDPSGNPRPRRLIEAFKRMGWRVSIAGFPPASPLPYDSYFEFRKPSMVLRHRIFRKLTKLLCLISRNQYFETLLSESRWRFSDVAEKIKNRKFDLVIIEDIHLLPFAMEVEEHARIILDAREYYPREFEHSLLWRLTERPHRLRVCREFLPRCDEVLTVSPGLAAEYEKEFGIRPHLYRSTPNFYDVDPVRPAESRIRMVHHGGANRDRKLEKMIELFAYLDDRFSLDFYLTGNSIYLNQLKRKAKKFPNIRFLSPVPLKEIVTTINGYDIGLYLLQPTNFNTTYALPNKLFEFIQARLAVAIGPSPDMADIVNQYQCGFVSKNFDVKEMTEMLNNLSPEKIWEAKQASHRAAKELCFEKEIEKVWPLFAG